MTNEEIIISTICRVPKGKVCSYGQIAIKANLPGYARQVAKALKNLPKDHNVPWYRIINSQGKISFKQDSQQYRCQKQLLIEEGIIFKKEKIDLKVFGEF